MRTWLCVCLVLCTAVGTSAWRQAPDKLAGVWSGSWDAAGVTGGLELTIEAGKDGAFSGRVSVTGEPTYEAVFTSLTFDGPKMTATYDFPPDNSILIKFAGDFESAKASGTWAAVTKAGGDEVAAGTWTATKK